MLDEYDTDYYNDVSSGVVDDVVNYDYGQHLSLDYYEVDDYIY